MNEEQNIVIGDEQGTPPVEQPTVEQTEEVAQLEAEKQRLEAEINGLEGTKKSLLDDVVRTRKERKEHVEPTVDIEAIKAEVEASILGKVSGEITTLKEELIKSKESEIKAKKSALDSITARMASASSSRGQASPDSLVETNQVELSKDEKELAQELGLKNPRYLKDVEIR